MASNTVFSMGDPENACCATIMNAEKAIIGMQATRKHRMTLSLLSN